MAARLTAFLVSAIVAVTFVAGLIVGAQREDDGGPADLIIHNARVYLGASTEAAEAVAIRDGKIVRVGSNKEIDRLRRRQTLDAAGGTVVAGLNDTGATLIDDAPDLTRAQRLDRLKKAIEEAHQLGLTSVQTTVGSAEELGLLDELKKADALKLRVLVSVAATLPLTDESFAALEALRKQAAADAKAPDTPALLKVNAVKLTLGTPADPKNGTQKTRPNGRKPATDQVTELADAITRLDSQHWQIIVSATTAAEATVAMDAFEQAFGAQAAASIRGRRHRVELSAPLEAAQTARLSALELIPSLPASIAAALATTAAPAAAVEAGTTATVTGIPAATLPPADADVPPATNPAAAAAGLTMAGLAELLVTNPLAVIRGEELADPMTAIAAAASAAEPIDAIGAILDAYTARAAYAGHEETAKGTIAKDHAADLVIFSTDLFAAPTDRPLDAFVTATIVNGEVVFTRSASAKPAATDNNN